MKNITIKEIRPASKKDFFYSANPYIIREQFKKFDNEFAKIDIPKSLKTIRPKAIIVPHAGYVYSGYTASMAYQFIKNQNYKRIIVIGPSHYYPIEGITASYFKEYETPLFNIQIDLEYINAISKNFEIKFEENIHREEHSTETQMPFIKAYSENIPVIELVYGNVEYEKIKGLIEHIVSDKNNLLIISTDLSHFYNLDEANQKDNNCLEAFVQLDPFLFKDCEACGMRGLESIIDIAKEQGWKSQLLNYNTSYDETKDSSSVVGYMSGIIF